MPKYEELRALKGKLVEKGYTYRSLAKRTNIPLNSISNILNGNSLANISQVATLCEELDITPERIPHFFMPSCCVTQQDEDNLPTQTK